MTMSSGAPTRSEGENIGFDVSLSRCDIIKQLILRFTARNVIFIFHSSFGYLYFTLFALFITTLAINLCIFTTRALREKNTHSLSHDHFLYTRIV